MDVPMERVSTTKTVAFWVLKLMLAGVFMLVGIQKLIGGEAWVRIFEMARYPDWFRTVVGVIETVGGLGLLVPSLAAYAAIALAVVMFGATFTQLVSGGGREALASFALLVALIVVARGRWGHALHARGE